MESEEANSPAQNSHSLWLASYRKLRAFYEEHGHCNAKTHSRIYRWAGIQRNSRADLTEEQIRLLDEIKFDWELQRDKFEKQWQAMFLLLTEYKTEVGHTRIHEKAPYKGKQLGRWAYDQKLRRKNGKLKPKREEQLNEIEFHWEHVSEPNEEQQRRKTSTEKVLNAKYEKQWQSMFRLLTLFKSKEGHTRISRRQVFRDKPLGRWVYDQKLRCEKGKLKKSRKDQLDGIEFDWDRVRKEEISQEEIAEDKADDSWDEGFDALTEYKGQAGDTLVPLGTTWTLQDGTEIDLGDFVKEQRELHRNLMLPSDRKERLEHIGFVFSTEVEDAKMSDPKVCDDALQSLDEYKGKHGNCNVLPPKPTAEQPKEAHSVTDNSDNTKLNAKGGPGPDGAFVAFPSYSGSEEPVMWQKAFGQFRQRHRKATRASLEPSERSKERVNAILRERFVALPESEKRTYRSWAAWDKRRYEHEMAIFGSSKGRTPNSQA